MTDPAAQAESDARVAGRLVLDAAAHIRLALRRAERAGPSWPLPDRPDIDEALTDLTVITALLRGEGAP